MLGLSMVELAQAARLSVSTVKRVEDGGPVRISDDAVAQIRDALEVRGVRFLPEDGEGPGLRFRQP